jgi:hypothetical protein
MYSPETLETLGTQVPNVASVSGLYILNCLIDFL